MSEYFKSKNIKVFPCAGRSGNYDQGARQVSEQNFRHIAGLIPGLDSYKIKYDSGTLFCVIHGYYFEISGWSEEPKSGYLSLKLSDLDPKKLASWKSDVQTLDDSSDVDSSEFTALKFIGELSPVEDFYYLDLQSEYNVATEAFVQEQLNEINFSINDGKLIYKNSAGDEFTLGTVQGENGNTGDAGADGVGIAKIEKTSSDGNVDTYTITLTDRATYTFTVTNGTNGTDGKDGVNGKDGKDGTNGVDGKAGTNGKDGLTPHIGENGNWWIGEEDTEVKAAGADGKDGEDGKDGQNGTNGKSAYEIAQAHSFEGTESDWLESLNGARGSIWFTYDTDLLTDPTNGNFYPKDTPLQDSDMCIDINKTIFQYRKTEDGLKWVQFLPNSEPSEISES